MWWVIFFIWFFVLTVLFTACAVAPMASYRDPVTGQLCWGRLDAETLTCAKEGRR